MLRVCNSVNILEVLMERRIVMLGLVVFLLLTITACDPHVPMTEEEWNTSKENIINYIEDESNYKETKEGTYEIFQLVKEWMQNEIYAKVSYKNTFPGYIGEVAAAVGYKFDGERLYQDNIASQLYEESYMRIDLDEEFQVIKINVTFTKGEEYTTYHLGQEEW